MESMEHLGWIAQISILARVHGRENISIYKKITNIQLQKMLWNNVCKKHYC